MYFEGTLYVVSTYIWKHCYTHVTKQARIWH